MRAGLLIYLLCHTLSLSDCQWKTGIINQSPWWVSLLWWTFITNKPFYVCMHFLGFRMYIVVCAVSTQTTINHSVDACCHLLNFVLIIRSLKHVFACGRKTSPVAHPVHARQETLGDVQSRSQACSFLLVYALFASHRSGWIHSKWTCLLFFFLLRHTYFYFFIF